jgi:hypothetical protein
MVWAGNVFSILFMITSLSHLVGVVDESEFTERLPNLFTMLLVSVAFKLAIASQLPTISYQTMLDIYAYYSILWIAVLIFEVAIAHLYDVEEDGPFFITTGCGWALYNLKFCGDAYVARKRELRLRKKGLGDWQKDEYVNNIDVDESADE